MASGPALRLPWRLLRLYQVAARVAVARRDKSRCTQRTRDSVVSTVGEQLRKRRQERGLGIEAVVRATRLPRSAIEALEADRFEDIAAAVYVRGFLRLYARHLELPEGRVLELYESQVSVFVSPEEAPVDAMPPWLRGPARPSRALSPAQIFILVITAATLVIFMLSAQRNQGAPQVADATGVAAPQTPATANSGPPGGDGGAATDGSTR